MRRDPLRSPHQKFFHLFVVVSGWALFVLAWVRVASDLPDYAVLAEMVIGTLVVAPLVTLYWVLHNLAIARVKGPRTRAIEAEAHYVRDWNGRDVVADWEAVRTAGITVIGIVDGRKVYRTLIRRDHEGRVLTRIFAKG
jgi:hypothetical protein